MAQSSTSVGANHRAACRARSQNEFHAKISIALEEADESHYWLESIDAKNINCDKKELEFLVKEDDEFTRILSTARFNTKRK